MSNNLTSCTNLAVSGNITTSSIISTTSQANTLNTTSITTNTLSLSGNDLSSTLNNHQNSINTLNTNYTSLNSNLGNFANKTTTNTFISPQTFTKNPSDSPFMITMNGTSDGSKPYDGCIVMYGANNTTTGSGVGLVMNPQGFGNPASFILSFVESGGNNITFATRNTNRMIIKNDGKVGIGTTTPSQLLDVNGNVNISGNITTGGTFNTIVTDVSGNITTNGAVNASSFKINNTDIYNYIQSQITTLQTQITSLQNSYSSLIKIDTRLRVQYSAGTYVIITQSNITSVTKLANGVVGIVLTNKSNVINAWTPFVSCSAGTRLNVNTGTGAGFPSMDYVVTMSSDYDFSFMLIDQ